MRPAIAFITSTGTECGKTYVTRGLARALVQRGLDVAALKPIETGCNPDPLDALALAEACANPELADLPGFYRAKPPLSPYAITLETGAPAANLAQLARLIRLQAGLRDFTLVEGAGGLLTPTSQTETLADLAAQLEAPLILVAPNRLGTLSHTLTAAESAAARGLAVACVILSEPDPHPPAAAASNLTILRGRLSCPVVPFPHVSGGAAVLADAAGPILPHILPPA